MPNSQQPKAKRALQEIWTAETKCPSSDDLRPIRHFENGGSGSSGLEFRRPAADAASDGLQ